MVYILNYLLSKNVCTVESYMWSPKQQVLKLARSLRRARSIELPKDNKHAVRVLLELVVSNHHGTLSDLLSGSTFDVNFAFGRVKKTLLHIAANCGHIECLAVLLRKGANPDIQDISGCVALHLAARNGQKRCVEKLLESGANPDISGNDGATAIHWLAVNGRDEILKVILSYTTQVNLEDGQGHTALHAAARNGHTKAMECLMAAGADVNYCNSNGVTPLHSACSNGQRHAITLLLSKGACLRPNSAGQTPVELCLMGGYGIASELLLKHSPNCLKEFVNKAVYHPDVVVSRIIECVKYFACSSLGPDVAYLLAAETADIGFKLLSLLSDSKVLLPALIHSSLLLKNLYESVPNSQVNKYLEVFSILEPLWKSLEDWLILLRDDVECIDFNEKAIEVTQNMHKCTIENGTFDQHETIVKVSDSSEEISSIEIPPENNTTQTMLPKMAKRLSGLINVFYVCITCHKKGNSMPLRFTNFIKCHIQVLKGIVFLYPKIIFEHFSFLFNSNILMSLFLEAIICQPFVDRYNWFYDHLKNQALTAPGMSSFQVSRNKIFEDSCSQIENFTAETLKQHLSVQFMDEEGVGDGVLREWFSLLSNEILNPEYCLFTQSSDGCTFQPCSNSAINPDHLSYFRFAGRILGLALYHRQLVNVSFTLSFYKHLLGRKVNYRDVASIDPEYAKNLQWILDNDVTDLGLGLNFVVETDVFGAMEEIELKPNGSNISVNEENKAEYVQLVTELRMTRAIQPQIDAFMEGFSQFIPRSLLQIFSEDELDMLFSGSRAININDWKKITNYGGCYNDEHQVILWFWQCVEELNDADRSLLVQFVTGRSRLPSVILAQNSELKFMITEIAGCENQLPTASTCMNMLKLPHYDTYQVLKEKLLIAIRLGSYGYSFT